MQYELLYGCFYELGPSKRESKEGSGFEVDPYKKYLAVSINWGPFLGWYNENYWVGSGLVCEVGLEAGIWHFPQIGSERGWC